MTSREAMLHILALDQGAHVCFSQYTNKWYVSARIEITDGSLLTGGTEHRDDIEDAILAYMARLQEIDVNETERALVTGAMREDRTHWRWNGATFTRDLYWQSKFAQAGHV